MARGWQRARQRPSVAPLVPRRTPGARASQRQHLCEVPGRSGEGVLDGQRAVAPPADGDPVARAGNAGPVATDGAEHPCAVRRADRPVVGKDHEPPDLAFEDAGHLEVGAGCTSCRQGRTPVMTAIYVATPRRRTGLSPGLTAGLTAGLHAGLTAGLL